MDLRFLKSPRYDNHIFSGWSLCLYLLSAKLRNEWQQKPQLWFSAFVSYADAAWMFSWTWDKNSACRCEEKNSNTLRPMDVISCLLILVYLNCSKCNEINIFPMLRRYIQFFKIVHLNCSYDFFNSSWEKITASLFNYFSLKWKILIYRSGMMNLYRIRVQKKKKDNIERQSSVWMLIILLRICKYCM